MDEEDNIAEPDVLKRDIITRRARAEKLLTEIPMFCTVSFFEIDLRYIRDTLSAKHLWIADKEVELIAK